MDLSVAGRAEVERNTDFGVTPLFCGHRVKPTSDLETDFSSRSARPLNVTAWFAIG